MVSEVLSYLISPKFQNELFPVKIVLLLFAVFFGISTIIFFFKTSWFEEVFLRDFIEIWTYSPHWKRGAKSKWNKIIKRLKKGKEAELKLAVIDADQMLADVLNKIGYPGETLSESLAKIDVETLTNLEEVKEAHKIASNVMHDPDYDLDINSAEKVLRAYKNALISLEAF
ncbi:MAG: hypothetical protein ABH967_00695 [Patescibacteria group bacterium]